MPVFSQTSAVRPDSRAAKIEAQNRAHRAPLSKFERKALEQGTEAVYIYNVSPIFRWERLFIGMGQIILQPRAKDQPVSEPLILAKRLVRSYDAGDHRFDHMIEEPVEIAEDFLRCSKDFPGLRQNDLTTWGCFMLIGTPFLPIHTKRDGKDVTIPSTLTDADRAKLLADANLAHENRLREKINEADGWANDNVRRAWITEAHRLAVLYLEEKEGGMLQGRAWVSMRGAPAKAANTKECQFCGFDCKASAVKCVNCHEIIDQAGYDALRKAKKLNEDK